MAVVYGQPTGVTTAAPQQGSSWKPSDIKEIIGGIRQLISEAKAMQSGQQPQQRPAISEHHIPPPVAPQQQPCKVETAVRDIYTMLDFLVNSGKGDVKLLELLQEKNPTVKDLRDILGKVV